MGISVAQPGIEPVSPALEAGGLATGTLGQPLGIYMLLQKRGWSLSFQEAILLNFILTCIYPCVFLWLRWVFSVQRAGLPGRLTASVSLVAELVLSSCGDRA